MIWRTGYGDWYYTNEGILWVTFWNYGSLSDVNIQYLIDDLVYKVRNEIDFDRGIAFSIPNGYLEEYWLRLEGE